MNTMTTDTRRTCFTFSDKFLATFKSMVDTYASTLESLNSEVNSSSTCDYGYCSTNYSLRIITPHNISEYVSNIIKAFEVGLLNYNVNDIQMFTVASVKKFLEENDCVPFEHTSMSNVLSDKYINPKEYTLTDLLIFAQNDIPREQLFSSYEIGIHRNVISNDVERVNNVHFTATIKNIVNAIPDIVNKHCMSGKFSCMGVLGDMLVDAIETFILFTISLNTISLESMLGYISPKSKFGILDKATLEPIQESVNINKNAPVFVILSEGKTPIVSRSIKRATNCNFSHVSISFDPSLKTMWSFAAKTTTDPRDGSKQKSGFKCESIDAINYKGKDINIGVYALYINKSDIKKMKKFVEEFDNNREDTKFDWHMMRHELFGKDPKPTYNKSHQICSTFVNSVLQLANISLTNKNIPSPKDFKDALNDISNVDKIVDIFYGNSNDYSEADTNKKLKSWTGKKSSRSFNDVVTECCLLKTNDIMIRNQLPFDCNIRNIVLQDFSEYFKDTRLAIHFMLKDQRSPIAQLILKYVPDTKRVMDYDGEVISRMLFKYCDKWPNEAFHPGPYINRSGMTTYTDPYEDVLGFHSDTSWLEKIVCGDIYLDGNYRRDARGNNAVHPIVNTLDTIYSMYNGNDITTNQGHAEHIVKISNMMFSIIYTFQQEQIENWEIVRDVLALLGEIMTRSILKLYHNNTRVVSYSDTMDDTMVPGIMYMESFVMEAEDGATTPANTTSTAPKVGVQSINQSNIVKRGLQKASFKIRQVISQFIRWIQDKLAKFGVKFAQNHKLEIRWVSANSSLNKEIATALGQGNNPEFSITVTRYPKYVVKLQNITDVNVTETINEVVNRETVQNVDISALIEKMLPNGLKNKNISKDISSDSSKTAIKNFILYGDVNHQPEQANQATKVTGEMFTELCNNILNTDKALTELNKLDAELKKAVDTIDKKLKDAENKAMRESQEKQNNETQSSVTVTSNQNKDEVSSNPEVAALTNIFKAVQSLANSYDAVVKNTIVSDFYKNSYNVYRDIVQAYKQQKPSKTNETPQQNEQPPVEQTPVDTVEASGQNNQ